MACLDLVLMSYGPRNSSEIDTIHFDNIGLYIMLKYAYLLMFSKS